MQLNIREEIIMSYKKLIENCQKAIDNNIDVEKNFKLIREYMKILNQVKIKSASDYDGVIKEMERMSKSNFNRTDKFNNKTDELKFERYNSKSI